MKFILTSILVCCFILTGEAQDEPYPLWKSLDPGSWQVGFTTTSFWRKEAIRKSDAGNERTQALPVQISIWYPTEENWSPGEALPFIHYFYLTEQKNDLEPLSDEQRDRAMDIFVNFAKYGMGTELSEEAIDDIRHSPTAAMENVPPANGRFPVLLAGHDGGVWKMSTLCEYLASHGYVVISTGPVSPTFRLLREDPAEAIKRRMDTFTALRSLADTLSYADTGQLGLLGLNFDAIPALLYQVKSGEAKAMMSVDGWEGKNNGADMLEEYFKPEPMSIPYFEVQQDESPEQESLMLNTAFFDSLEGDGYSLVIRDIGHAHLTGNGIAIPGLPDEDARKIEFWYSAVRLFFDNYLQANQNADGLNELIRSRPDDWLLREKIR